MRNLEVQTSYKRNIFNLYITYGILRFRRLRGWGVWPRHTKQVMVNGLIWNLVPIMVQTILVNTQKFSVIGFSTFRHLTSLNFLSRRERVIAMRYLPPGIEQNSKKNHFLCLKTSFLAQSYNPLYISMVLKQNKKIHMFNFLRRLISKTTAATPWWVDYAKILPKCVR